MGTQNASERTKQLKSVLSNGSSLTPEKAYLQQQALLHKVKLGHLDTVIKSECLYAAETLYMVRKAELEDIRNSEVKMLINTLISNMKDEAVRFRPNKILCQQTK